MALTKITRGVIKANENYDTHNINSTGIITAVSANFTGNVSIGGTLTYQDVTNIDSVGIITARAGVKFPDSQKVFLGTGDDLQIYHDGTHSYVKNATGNLYFQHGNENMIQLTSDGNVELYYDNAKKFETHSSGVVISGNLQLNDNNIAYFGESQDLSIYHNGAQNLIISATGQVLETRADLFQVTNSAGNENLLQANGDGAVNLYYNGTKKFETQTSGVVIHEDTDKTIRFTGGIGEIGNVTGFQATNTAGSAIVDLGMRGTTLRFATGSSERIRISSDGALLVGDYGGSSGRFVLFNADQAGGADTTYSKDKGLYVRNDCGPTHVDLTGVDNFTAKIHNGAYAGSGVANPQGSISKLLLHGVTYNGYNAYGAISLDVQGANHGRGDLVFLNGGNSTSISERLRITGGGTVKINPAELQTTAGDKFAQIRGGGIINTKRFATGHFGNTAAYQAQQLGYIGDYMHYGCNAIYYLAQTSTGNSGYSSHMFSWYDSGHWGHYGKFVLMCHEVSYIGGMCHRFLSGTSVSTIFSIGQASSASTTSTTTGSGTHSGQSVTRYDCTVSHSGTYRTVRWYLGLLHGAQLGVTGNGKSQSDCNTYANSNGSLLHLFGVSDSNLTMAPNYRTW